MARKLVVEIIGDSASLERAFRRSSTASNQFGRNMNNASRGVLAATASFVGLRRAVLSTSASFLGGVGVVAVLKSTIAAAAESQRVLGQTRNAVERSGLSWEQYGKRIRAAADAQSRLSGFDDERLLSTFSNLVRRTGDVNEALRLNALAANVARGRNIELEAAQQLVLKASIGNVGALRRLGINIDKTATAQQALDLLNRKYANSAAAYGKTAAGAQDRFRVAIENLQETVGAELLPVITKYLNAGANWLNNTKNQREVTDAVKRAVSAMAAVVKDAVSVVRAIDRVTGSFVHTLTLLGSALLAAKAKALLARAGLLEYAAAERVAGAAAATSTSKVTVWSSGVVNVGRQATMAAGKIGRLSAALGDLPTFVGITLAIDELITQRAADKAVPAGAVHFLGKGKPGDRVNIAGQGPGVLREINGQLFIVPLQQRNPLRGGVFGENLFPASRRPLPTRVGGTSQTTLFTLTSAQQRAIALSGNPSLDALRAQQSFDKAQLAGLDRRFKAHKIGAKAYANAVVKFRDDLASVEDQIASLLKETARAVENRAKGLLPHRVSGSLQLTSQQLRSFFRVPAKVSGSAQVLAESFAVPLQVQLEEAKVAATGKDLTPILKKMKAAAERALKSGKLSLSAQIDAWNEIAGINDQLKGQVTRDQTKFRHISVSKLLAGTSLSLDERRHIATALAQVGRGGTIPQPSLAFGAAGAEPIVVPVQVNIDGKPVTSVVTKHQRKAARRRVTARRGPWAGRT